MADIYQSMLSGDKSSLFKLQQVNVMAHLPHVRTKTPIYRKPKVNTEENASLRESNPSENVKNSRIEEEFKETTSAVNVNHKKEQAYMNVVKKGAKMGAIPRN